MSVLLLQRLKYRGKDICPCDAKTGDMTLVAQQGKEHVPFSIVLLIPPHQQYDLFSESHTSRMFVN